MLKRWISLAVCLVFLMTGVFPAKAAGENDGSVLTAREDNTFRILIVSDFQDIDKPQERSVRLLEAELDAADPDLVIFLGDNIYGVSIGPDDAKAEAAIRAVVDPVAERNIPFGFVFGNHDDETCMSKEKQLAIYQSYPGCVNEDAGVSGVGNTCLEICANGSDDPAVLLWLIDSGTYAEEGGYAYVKQDQIDWFKSTIAQYPEENRPVSYAFQHIPVPQVFEMLEEAKPFSKGAFCTFANPFSQWYTQKDEMIRKGRFTETPCPPDIDGGEFAAWKEIGVKAAFFGHDHANDYEGTVDGVDLIATCGIGFYSYGRGDEHGARLLVLHLDEPDVYETEMIYYKDLFDDKLTIFDAPTIGAEYGGYSAWALAGLVVLIVAIVFVVRAIRKKHPKGKKKK
ncbi:MAG: metallophosphoesterase [Firmicutes bacterium]|nr:metallophosphoesterase [Bacillota bacterium]